MKQTITFRDQSTIDVEWFTAAEPQAVVICLPAMGVRASYYRSFAEHLQQQGLTAITADWRGQGTSSVRPSRKVDYGYETLVQDLHELIQAVRQEVPSGIPVVVAGHSLGGQIASLCAARYRHDLDGLILIASCLVHYTGWDGWQAQRVRLAGHLFYPLSRIVGYFPGQVIGFGGKEARTVMYDWCYNLLYGSYRPAGSDFDYEAGLSRSPIPVLAFSFAEDNMAPERAVLNLCNKFSSNSRIIHQHLSLEVAAGTKHSHFAWVKEPTPLSPIITGWLTKLQ